MVVCGLALWLVVLSQAPVTGAEPAASVGVPPGVTTARVRALDARAFALLEEGSFRSPTFKHLVETLEEGDVIVLIETGLVTTFPAQTTFMSATPEARFLHVMLGVPESSDRLIAWLAHELQHAVEIASAPEVTSVATLYGFYREHGQVLSERGVCTAEAQKVTTRVGGEVALTASPRS